MTLDSLATPAKHNVALVSITENIDYSTPRRKLFTQMLGAFAQYFCDALATHVSKGMGQRATEGKHTGGIPFGYESCWMEEDGQRRRSCNPEHPGGIHIHPQEGPAVAELFRRYVTGTATLSQLASWLNSEGFRTRNTKRLPDENGNLSGGPRLFTASSVRIILHNPFYTGKVKYKKELLPGAHDPLVSQELFDLVQITLKKNSGSASRHPGQTATLGLYCNASAM